jgi:hypothetical protein
MCVWYMNVPARGGVKRATKLPPGSIHGVTRSPSTPSAARHRSNLLSTSMPCQCRMSPGQDRFWIVISTRAARVEHERGPGALTGDRRSHSRRRARALVVLVEVHSGSLGDAHRDAAVAVAPTRQYLRGVVRAR